MTSVGGINGAICESVAQNPKRTKLLIFVTMARVVSVLQELNF
jgi:F0F1-type ATP synthase membrane subunit c/vacuolar-type H+-ATPase subunit K